MSTEDFSLARLISPRSTEEFKRAYWETAPLVVAREEPSYYRDLFTLADVDRILSLPLRSPPLRVLRDGEEVPIGGHGRVANAEAVYEQFRNGSTISLQFLQERISSLAELCRSLADEFSASFQVNAYLTPPDERGLATHYDTHDVFVLQIAGTKHWRIFDETIRLPLPGQSGHTSSATPDNMIDEFDLQPGDAIYIPRGFAHDARAVESISLHLTVGVRPITWAFMMLSVVEALIEQEPRFREALPIGFAADGAARQTVESQLSALLDVFRDRVDVEQAVDNAIAVVCHRKAPSLDSHLLDLGSLPYLQLDTRVRRRSAVLSGPTSANGKTELSFHGKRLRMPAFVAPDLEFVGQAETFTARDLPGALDESGRLVLIKRLVREGLLTVCS